MLKIALLSLFLFSVGELHATLCDNVIHDALQASDPMPKSGAYAGQMVENIKGRTLRLLTAKEKSAFGINPSALAFANFRHQGQFYIAHLAGFIKVDENGTPTSVESTVEETVALNEHWEALTHPELQSFESHAYLRFAFKPNRGIWLDVNQGTGEKVDPSPESLVSTAVLSIEALRPQSDPDASFIPHALVLDFAVGHLFYSAVDREASEAGDTGRIVVEEKLDFSKMRSRIPEILDPAMALLYGAIRSSPEFARAETYNFVLNNCTNGMFDIIDKSIEPIHGFNRMAFFAAVKAEVAAEIPAAFRYAQALVNQNGLQLPPSILTELNRLLPDEVQSALINGAINSADPGHYQTWFPPFVEAHLIGRRLIAKPTTGKIIGR